MRMSVDTDYQRELSKAKRDPKLWWDQCGNIISATLWAFGAWMMVTTLLFSALSLGLFLSLDADSPISIPDLQEAAWNLLSVTSVLAAGVVALFGLPRKMKNVFALHAHDRFRRNERIIQDISTSIDVTETLLVKHGLISENDVECRKAGLRRGRLL